MPTISLLWPDDHLNYCRIEEIGGIFVDICESGLINFIFIEPIPKLKISSPDTEFQIANRVFAYENGSEDLLG